MATYVLLTTLTAEGVRTVKRDPGRIDEVNREVERLGVTVREPWAILGAFDFLTIIEASDPRTMLRLSLELGSRGTARCRSVAAIPIDEFVAAW